MTINYLLFSEYLRAGKWNWCKEKIMCDVTMYAAANFVFK